MLGRLEMDVEECIVAYNSLLKQIFEKKAHRIPFGRSGRLHSRFDSAKLKTAIEEVIVTQGYSTTEPFNDGKCRGCRVFVCSAEKHIYGITRLRSYDHPHESKIAATISEAALATAAATGFFDPVSIGARCFIDGALGANNPVVEVEREASDIWCTDTGDLKPLVKCFVSIGTGNPGKRAVEDNLLKFLTKTLAKITTDTERVAEEFASRWRHHYDQKRYFRLSVEQGLQDVGLAEYKEQGRIEAATDQYLRKQQQSFGIRDCVESLRTRQNAAPTDQSHECNVAVMQARTITEASEPLERRQLTSTVPHSSCVCHSIPPVNKRFIPREDIFETLHQKLFKPNETQRVTLFGLGGIGKTQVALHLAHWTKVNEPTFSVFWVSAINNAAFVQTYTDIRRKLAVQETTADGDARECVQRFLDSPDAGKWLIVVDNADDMQVLSGSSKNSDGIQQYLPESDNGVILFTSRSREVALALNSELVELKEMTTNEAERLLEKSLVEKDLLKDRDVVKTLLQELTYLPLAITQAAGYLNRNRITISKYMDLLGGTETELVALMSREFPDTTRQSESRHAVATTWVVSFDQIQVLNPPAAELLTYLSLIEPKAIPLSILPPLNSMEAIVHAIGTLTGYAFLVQRGDTEIYDMHSLVHLASRIWVSRTEHGARVEKEFVEHLTRVFPRGLWENREQRRLYLPHALRLLRGERTMELRERYSLLGDVGECLRSES
ncbi:uncharacterized protein PV06_09271 [Exophiala oligosperma]|uniref:PNPLA domain-containing protein n=1 Tax=Exophiala oligosperma TaxID=215243 RepID=A0A0D2ADL4_9EURO|nr:uncharacterized protein PV06_09271 [Exophiala oligosperma]KIW38296.1 hypothetical protein PV06_09271 [Exophiala oligosperma]